MKINKKGKITIASLAAVILIAASTIITSSIIHNQKQKQIAITKIQEAKRAKFYKTHFLKDEIIYDVDVSNLTPKQAYKKINQQSPNCLILQNNKIKELHVKQNADIITLAEVKQNFKTISSSDKNSKYNIPNTKLNDARHKLKQAKRNYVQFKVNKDTYKITSQAYTSIKYINGKYEFNGEKKVTDFINSINKKYATLNKTYPFITPDKKEINITNQSYGWKINSEKVINTIHNDLLNKDDPTNLNVKDYLVGKEFLPNGTGFIFRNNGLGNNYIAVSIAKQHVWVVRNNKVVLSLSDVVTGTNNPGNKTPKGVWYIGYKQSPSVLRGNNNDGSPYASPVKYWMPFTESGCGFHDANWRSNWSKTAYLSDGSHGCVNLTESEAATVWKSVYQGMPVVVY